MNTQRTGRELDVNKLVNSTKKVTLGFKCEARLKMELALEAERFSMSLSEYVEVLVARRSQVNSQDENRMELEMIKSRLRLYENDTLKKIYLKNKGQKLSYKDGLGSEKIVLINDLTDIHFVILESIKQ